MFSLFDKCAYPFTSAFFQFYSTHWLEGKNKINKCSSLEKEVLLQRLSTKLPNIKRIKYIEPQAFIPSAETIANRHQINFANDLPTEQLFIESEKVYCNCHIFIISRIVYQLTVYYQI